MEQQQSDVVLGSIGGWPATVPRLVVLLFTLPHAQHCSLTHSGISVITQAFVAWARLMSAKCSRPAATGGHACAPFVIPEPTGPDAMPETEERRSADMCWEQWMDGWMDRQQNFCGYRNCQTFWCSILSSSAPQGPGEVAQMAYTYQVILNEQIKAMCLPIEILWILFLEQVKSI